MNLTHHQWLVWCCWDGGMNIRQTAETLQISTETVKSQRATIRSRIGVDPMDAHPPITRNPR